MSLNNPLLFGLLIAMVVTVVVILFFFKVFFPLQKKRFIEKQKHILETAELMALFSEMDPSPQVRVNIEGKIVQTNRAAREVFKGIDNPEKSIKEILPALNPEDLKADKHFIESIGESIFSISIRPGKNYDFINIYLYDITKQKNYESSLEEYKNKLKDLADKLDSSIESVKKTVSQELHDDIGHSLMALKLKASLDEVNNDDILAGIITVYEKVRELSRELRPADIGKLGLVGSIQSLINNITNTSGIKGTFDYYGKEVKAGENIAICILRVTQEALSNIVKHSKASEFTIGLKAKEEMIELIIADNGTGIPEKYFNAKNYRNFGVGLFNMKERVEKYNGAFTIKSNPDTGTLLIIQLPLNEKQYENN